MSGVQVGGVQCKLSIDRIRLVLPLASKELHKAYLEVGDEYGSNPAIKYYTLKNGRRLYCVPLGMGQRFVMSLGFTKAKMPFASFDFLPASLNATTSDALQAEFQLLPGVQDDEWWEGTSVSYIEVAADFPGIWVKDVLPFSTNSKKSRWFPSSDSPSPTHYVGSRSSGWQLRVYDRPTCLAAKGHEVVSGAELRAEVALRRLKCAPAALASLPNPFVHAGFVGASTLSAMVGDAGKTFVENCQSEGIVAALSMCGKQRKTYLALIQSSAAKWWDPEAMWLKYPLALLPLSALLVHSTTSVTQTLAFSLPLPKFPMSTNEPHPGPQAYS